MNERIRFMPEPQSFWIECDDMKAECPFKDAPVKTSVMVNAVSDGKHVMLNMSKETVEKIKNYNPSRFKAFVAFIDRLMFR